MILRRFMLHVKEQNWFAVGLDVIVVIVGIFLGLQVQALYDRNEERERESFYLTEIYNELGKNISVIEESIEFHQKFQKMGVFLSSTIDNPELVKSQPTYFIVAVEVASYNSDPNVTSNTFQDLNFSGDRSIFRDKALLSELTGYYNNVERARRELDRGIEAVQQRYFTLVDGILTHEQLRTINTLGPSSDEYNFTEEEALAAYEKMILRPAFIDQIPRATNQGYAIRSYQFWKSDAEDLRAKIKNSLPKN